MHLAELAQHWATMASGIAAGLAGAGWLVWQTIQRGRIVAAEADAQIARARAVEAEAELAEAKADAQTNEVRHGPEGDR